MQLEFRILFYTCNALVMETLRLISDVFYQSIMRHIVKFNFKIMFRNLRARIVKCQKLIERLSLT